MHRAAGQTYGINIFNHAGGIQQIRLASARSRTSHFARSRGPIFRNDYGDPTASAFIVGIANRDTVDIGNQISRAETDHNCNRPKIVHPVK